MEIPQLLPDNVLRRQVCQECFQYLSVPPITINNLGETICGRCFGDSSNSDIEAKKYTKSSFNIIAERFLFKCTNHLNGCPKLLDMSETKEHERTCSYDKHECFSCSFSGNLNQILIHSLKLHPENVSLDGKISFFLNDEIFQKQVLLLNGNLFHADVGITDDFFTVVISPITKALLPTANQYGIRFFRPDDPTNVTYIHTDFGLLNDSMETYFKKSKGSLVTFFGLGVKICCEILIQQFSLTEREFEIKQRSVRLRNSEEQLNNSKQELQVWAKKLSQQNEVYNAAMNVIKRMSYDFFKCCSCQKITLEETYFCPKNHCCCKSCLTNTCKMCNSVQEFNRLEEIERFIILCDWPGCNKNFFFKDYLKHKNGCLQRPYKCPLLKCHEIVCSSQKLVEHWHCVVPAITEECEILCESYIHMEYYWIIKNNLYHVLINFDDTLIQVLINEIDVLPNNICFKCEGCINDWKQITPSTFCGKFHIYTSNSVKTLSTVTVTSTKKKQSFYYNDPFNDPYSNHSQSFQPAEKTVEITKKYTALRISYS